MTNRFPAYKYILTAFFLSGLSSLILQVAWQRILDRYIGVALPSVAAVAATFIAGLGFGAVFAFYLLKKDRSGLYIYAASQFLVGLIGIATVAWQAQFESCLASIVAPNLASLPFAYALRLTLVVLFLLLPATLIGASYPALAHYLKEKQAVRGEAAWLYGFNLLGSAFGAILAGLTLIPYAGIASTVLAASGTGFLALLFLIPHLQMACQSPERTELKESDTGNGLSEDLPKLVPLAAIVAIAGALSMVLEVIWTRLFMLICGASSYAFAIVLGCQLLSLAAGGLFLTFCLLRSSERLTEQRAHRILGGLTIFAGLAIYLSLISMNLLPWAVYSAQNLLISGLNFSPVLAFLLARVLVALAMILIPCLCLGGVFPTIVSLSSSPGRQGDERLLKIYLANVIGAVGGCLLAGIVLLPLLTRFCESAIQMALYLAVLVSFVLCLYSGGKSRFSQMPAALAALAILGVSGYFCLPHWDKELLSRGVSFLPSSEKLMAPRQFRKFALNEREASQASPFKPLFYKEGLNATVSAGSMPERNIIFLKTDGKTEATLPDNPALPAPESDIVSQRLLGSLPVLLCPLHPESILLIGMGSGATAGAILDSPEVKELTIAELEKTVFEAAPLFVGSNSHVSEILNNDRQGRVKKIVLDGRSLLSLLDKHYEVIVCQPGEPWLAGSAHLYTEEFWRLARGRLKKGGVFCQWIQLYNIDKSNLSCLLSTFNAVFCQTMIFHFAGADEVCLIGVNSNADNVQGLLSLKEIEERLRAPAVKKNLSYIGIHDWPALLATLVLAPPPACKAKAQEAMPNCARTNVDDRPLAEFAMPALITTQTQTIDPYMEEKCKAKAFVFDRLIGDFGQDKRTRANNIAKLALAYWDGGVAQPSSQMAQDLIQQALKEDDSPAIQSVASLVGLPGGTALTIRPKVAPEEALLISRWLVFQGQLVMAEDLLAAVVKASPSSVDCLCALGDLKLKLGEKNAALDLFKRAISIDSSKTQAWVGAAVALVELDKYKSAVICLKQALQLQPGQFQARFLLGKILCILGQEEEGLNQIVLASRQEPLNAEPNLYVTAYYVAKLQWEAARSNLSLLLRKLPNDRRSEYLATKIRSLGRVDENDREIKKLLRLL